MLFRSISGAVAGGLLVLGTVAEPVNRRVVPRSHSLHERQHEDIGTQWQKRERIPADSLLPMRIGLKQRNLRDGHERLMDMCVGFPQNALAFLPTTW